MELADSNPRPPGCDPAVLSPRKRSFCSTLWASACCAATFPATFCTASCRGTRSWAGLPAPKGARASTSMVRRGSTVRVRQRAFLDLQQLSPLAEHLKRHARGEPPVTRALAEPSVGLAIALVIPARGVAAAAAPRGNTEGTAARARASTRGQPPSVVPFGLRRFRARPFPCVPLLPFSELNGKEEAVGSSPTEGSKDPANRPVPLPA
jgi:hypothetical protein